MSTRRACIRLWLYALRVCLALGCSSPSSREAEPEGPCPVGDVDQPIEIVPIVRTADGRLEDVRPGGPIPLVEPPQGGQVVFVGVRARNLDGCGVMISSSLRDPDTGRTIGIEARPIDLAVRPDGWAQPSTPEDIASFANVPVCPSADATRALDGQRYVLDVDVRDRAKRTAHLTLDVIPTCGEATICPAECRGTLAR